MTIFIHERSLDLHRNYPMRVLVLGIGKMGYGLLKDLTAQSRIEEVVTADINITQA